MLLRVKDLIRALQNEDQNAIVFIANDPEGNSYSTVSRSFARSLLKVKRECCDFYIDEIKNLPNNTETVTIYPVH